MLFAAYCHTLWLYAILFSEVHGMDITKLQYFIAAAECGSFSETARRVYTSQPNISRQISSLEKDLGAKLFFRERNAVRLTRAGEYLYEQTKDMPGIPDHCIAFLLGWDIGNKLNQRKKNQSTTNTMIRRQSWGSSGKWM